MALLAKLNWRFHEEKDALQVRVLMKKYYTRRRTSSTNEASLPSSSTWKGLKRGETTFKMGVKWIPEKESNLNFWFDCWTNLGPIRQVIHNPIPQDSLGLKVKDVVGFGGQDWSLIPFELPSDIKAEIQGIPTPVIVRGDDKLAWKLLS